ncbi:MAG: glycosyltransferase family 39 protein, partial [Candidatus Omnitrophica bacterium]|nr:glycosyltransferase family 39 protein [Candidatus Omnitrophota bacterium]
MSMRIKPSHILLFIFILIAVTVRIYMFLNTDRFNEEEAFRRMDSYRFATHPLKIFRDTSLICTTSGCQRGFLFLNSLLMHFVDDPVLMPRLSSLIFGILVIIPYYLLVSSVFSQEIALASVFALAFYPVHVQLSVTSLGNAGAIFFVILSAYFFTRYLQINNIKENKIYLTASIIFAALATSFRAETSLLIIIFSLILLQERRFKAAIIFFIFSYTYVISRLWIERGFLCFLHVATGFENWNWPFNLFSAHTELSGLGKIRFFIWFDRLFHSFSLPLSVLGFLGIVSAFKNKKQYMVFLSCFFGFFIFLTIRDLIHTSTPFMRYSSFF